jgi:hypothetical protein
MILSGRTSAMFFGSTVWIAAPAGHTLIHLQPEQDLAQFELWIILAGKTQQSVDDEVPQL